MTLQFYSAVAVAGPFYWEFLDLVALSVCADNYFDIEGETLSFALGIEFSGYVALVDFESALCVCQMRGDVEPCINKCSKCF